MTLQKSAPNVVVRGLSPGPHTVALVGLAQNCRSDGANPVTVQASSADISPVEFSVNCLANSGAIAVAISVSDYSRPLFFPTQVDSSGVRGIAKGNSTTVLPGIFAGGLHKVTLTGIPTFCEPTGELSTSVEIKTGTAMQDTAIASFHMSCNPPDLQSDTAAAIVFERDGYVMLVRETGGSATAVTQGSKPVWAPDGNSIAFQRTKCDADQICERDLWLRAQAGNEEKPINTDPYFDDYDVAFSPTGDRISFVRIWLGPDQSYLMLSDLHGQSLKILSIWNPEGTPSWSPDGAQIVFSCQTGASFTMQLCLANPAGGCESYFPANCKLPLNVLTADPADHLEPAWSPDGSRVAFTVACGGYHRVGAVHRGH
jgi:Tol biopolymer transport system component